MYLESSESPPEPRSPMARRIALLWWRNSLWLRWTIAAIFALMAVVSAGSAEPTAAIRTVTIAVADIKSGSTISQNQITSAPAPIGPQTLREDQVVGERARGPIGSGELLTQTRLVPGRTVALSPGLVSFPLQLSDHNVVSLLSSGDRIDVLSNPTRNSSAPPKVEILARNLEVLTVPQQQEGTSMGTRSDSGMVLVAATQAQSLALAGHTPNGGVSIAIR